MRSASFSTAHNSVLFLSSSVIGEFLRARKGCSLSHERMEVVYFRCTSELPNPMLKTEPLRRELRAELLSRSTLADIQTGAGVVPGGAELGAASGVWPGMWYGIGCGGGLILSCFIPESAGMEDVVWPYAPDPEALS